MENMPIRAKKVIKVSRRNAIIFIIIVVVLGFLYFNNGRNRYMPLQYGDVSVTSSGTKSTNRLSAPSMMPDIFPYQNETSSVKDTREFMKVAYGAEIKTRDVKDAMRDVKSAIDSADGRIDNINETTKYSYVSFVVPKSNFNNFKDEIESITNEKLITENSSSQNLLGQKQSIEQQKQTATDALTELQKRQKNLTAQHTQTINNLQKELTAVQNQIIAVRATISATSNPDTLATLRNQEYNLSQQEISLKQSLNGENASYAINNQNLKNQISDTNAQLENIGKQDVAFTDNVETVNGYISVNWISLWDMAKIFSPIHPGWIIVILTLLAWYYLSRKNYLPSIEFV